jgi:hypothetical protein
MLGDGVILNPECPRARHLFREHCLATPDTMALWGAIIWFPARELPVRDSSVVPAWATGMPLSGRLPGPRVGLLQRPDL